MSHVKYDLRAAKMIFKQKQLEAKFINMNLPFVCYKDLRN